MWLDTAAFASLLNLSTHHSHEILAQSATGQPWHGHALHVRVIPSTDAKTEPRYEVRVDSLPAGLYRQWFESSPLPVSPSSPVSHHLSLPDAPHPQNCQARRHRDLALWKWRLIQPALACPKHSSARGEHLRQLASTAHARPDGRRRRVSLDSLYTWVAHYERAGLTALMRRPRRDAGRRVVGITRQWDKRCPLSLDTQQRIAEQLAEQVRSLWAAGAPGYRTVAELGSAALYDLSLQAGWQAVTLEDCRLSRSYVEHYRRYALLAMHDKDARQFFDRMVPRIQRHRDGLKPMDIIVGDVHPIDIRLTREDGSAVMPRAIAWMDVATQRLHVTLIQLEKGEGVKQIHVAQSFAAMCSAWGLPRQLYLDNGAEYGWQDMMSGFAQLSRLTGAPLDTRLNESPYPAVVRARPYNAQAKPIEGLFALLEQQVLGMLPGWIGGNRMRQKTHNVGREPHPYPGDWAAFHQSFDRALAYYHARAQPFSRSLKGQSPNQALSAAIAEGWDGAPQVDPLALRVAFSSEETRLIQGGGYVNWNGKTYFNDTLVAHNGKRLRIRFAKWDDRYLFVFDEHNQLICAAEEAQHFAFFGPEGARAQAQRHKLLKRHIHDLRGNTVRLDLEQAMLRRTELADLAPDLPQGPRIELTPSMSSMLQALKAQQAPTLPARPRHPASVTSQWLTPPNALLAALGDPEPDDEFGPLDAQHLRESLPPTSGPVSGQEGDQ
ncbi:Mu transposase C-terminal domain-containing protein [Pseudomonas sp. NPDC098747]|uniref:Mu transposase C-terminal domain-containing protein n=1 Tax=Pseudomonas sp. NPDC098747 TaxID=3364487 RepID=UPI003839E056